MFEGFVAAVKYFFQETESKFEANMMEKVKRCKKKQGVTRCCWCSDVSFCLIQKYEDGLKA